MAQAVLPKKPVENWETIRDDWVATVDRLISEAEDWSARRDWATRREQKEITEDRLGPYSVPKLLIHATFGRFLIDPVARFVAGRATGLIDFYAMPSVDWFMIVRDPDGPWFVHIDEGMEVRRIPWSEDAFEEAISLLRDRP